MKAISDNDALVVIDAQNDFVLSSGALYVAGVKGEVSAEEVIENVLLLGAKRFSYRVTTEDKHPQQHAENEIFPQHCVVGTPGQKYVKELQGFYEQCDMNIVKGEWPFTRAYSIATSNDFPKHIAILRAKEIKRVLLAGWAYDYCVGESAIAYASQGFEVCVVRDATRSVGIPEGNARVMSQKLDLYGVKEIFMEFIG